MGCNNATGIKSLTAQASLPGPSGNAEAETIKLMESAYLEGIDLIDTLPLASDFDVAGFKKDVQCIFSQDKWYELATAA